MADHVECPDLAMDKQLQALKDLNDQEHRIISTVTSKITGKLQDSKEAKDLHSAVEAIKKSREELRRLIDVYKKGKREQALDDLAMQEDAIISAVTSKLMEEPRFLQEAYDFLFCAEGLQKHREEMRRRLGDMSKILEAKGNDKRKILIKAKEGSRHKEKLRTLSDIHRSLDSMEEGDQDEYGYGRKEERYATDEQDQWQKRLSKFTAKLYYLFNKAAAIVPEIKKEVPSYDKFKHFLENCDPWVRHVSDVLWYLTYTDDENLCKFGTWVEVQKMLRMLHDNINSLAFLYDKLGRSKPDSESVNECIQKCEDHQNDIAQMIDEALMVGRN